MERIDRLRKELKAEGIEALLITDVTNRRYITGFTGTSGFALVTGERAQLITDFRYILQAQKQAPGLELVEHKDSIWQSAARCLYDLGVKELAFDKGRLTFADYEALKESVGDIKLIPTAGIVDGLRMIKDNGELAILEKAATIADKAYNHILSVIKSGMTEREVAFELEFTMRKLGAEAPSFDTIVASGARSALPHGVASDKRIEAGDLVTMDFGALYEGYCSDITRTVVIGEAGARQREIYGIVLEAQRRAIAGIRPGITGRDADALARDYITRMGYGDAFGHGTGHAIGLEIHEEPRLSKNSDTVLMEGMVVTVEPGIYIADFGGVRIEEDIVITKSGNRPITHSNNELTIV